MEDLYRPYKQKRKTRASVAKEKGLEPLAAYILEQNAAAPLTETAQAYVDAEKAVADAKEAIDGAKDIIAEQISDEADYRIYIRNLTFEEGKIVSTAKVKKNRAYTKIIMPMRSQSKKWSVIVFWHSTAARRKRC